MDFPNLGEFLWKHVPNPIRYDTFNDTMHTPLINVHGLNWMNQCCNRKVCFDFPTVY